MSEMDDTLILARALERRFLSHKQFLQLIEEQKVNPGTSMLEAALAHGWLTTEQLDDLSSAPPSGEVRSSEAPTAQIKPGGDSRRSPESNPTLAQPLPPATAAAPPPIGTMPAPVNHETPATLAYDDPAAMPATRAAEVRPFDGSGAATPYATPATRVASDFPTPDAPRPTPPPRDRSPLGPPTDAVRLRYLMKKQLARGGMGAVWLARDPAIERDVAVKELLPNALRSSAMIERFREEARLTGQLEHPGIVPIHELGTKPDGAPFYVMKLLSGRSFYQAIQETHQLPDTAPEKVMRFNDLLRVFVGICEAMAFAHSKGVIHRDLKPANVMVGDFGEAVVVDWGLAKPLGEPGGPMPEGFSGSGSVVGSRPSRTVAGSTLGTPSYMPPEQARGEWDNVDTRSDIFSLGAILFEVLTGRPPYKADDLFEILDMAHECRVPKPRSIRPDVAPELEAIALKALAADANARYQTARELAEEVKRFQAGEPVSAYPEPWTKRANRWLKRNKALAGSIAVGTFAVLTLVIAWWAWEARRFAAVARKADELIATGRVELESARAEAALETLGRAAGLVESERGLAEWRPIVADLRDRAEARVRAVSRKQERADNLARFRAAFDDAMYHATGTSGEDRAAMRTKTRESAGAALAIFGVDPDRGGTPATDGFDEAETAEIERHSRTLWLVLALADAQPVPGQTAEERAKAAQQARTRLERGTALKLPAKAAKLIRAYASNVANDPQARDELAAANALPAETADDHFFEGFFALTNDDPGKALREFDAALRLQPGYFWASALSGLAYANLPGKTSNAVAYLTSAIDRRPGLYWLWTVRGYVTGLGESSPEALAVAEADFARAAELAPMNLALFVNRAAVRSFHGDFAGARADLEQARSIAPQSPLVFAALGDLAMRRQQTDEALRQYDEAVRLAPDDARWRIKRALVRERARNWDQALEDLTKAAELLPPGDEATRVQFQRAKVLAALKQYGPALAAIEAVLTARPDYADAHCLHGELLATTDRREEAVAAFNRYLELTRDPNTAVTDQTAYRDRGLMRLLLQDYAGGVADLDRFLAMAPAEPNEFDRQLLATARRRRGWALLERGAVLAVGDFDQALRLEPRSADALNGRAFAHAMTDQPEKAIADAEAAVAVADADLPSPRQRANIRYNAACVFAEVADRDPSRAAESRTRALKLLREALELTPQAQRPDFARMIREERSFRSLRSVPEFQKLLAE